jgi:hypothetical protein
MKAFLLKSMLALASLSIPLFATTVDFNAYGAASGLGYGDAEWLYVDSLTFPGFTLSTAGSQYGLQLDAPGYYGAVNYELLGEGDLTVTFSSAQSGFSTDVRDFSGYGGTDTVSVYGTDDTTLLATYFITLNGSISTFTDLGESAAIGAVSFSNVGGEYWTGILQSVTYGASEVPEPASFAVVGLGLLVLGFARRRL